MKDMHFESMTGDILAFMRHVGIHKAIWMGHSYGAKMGYFSALQYAQHVSAVIALDIAPISYESKLPQFKGMMELFKGMESKQWKNRKEIEQFIAAESPTMTEMEIKFMTKPFVPTDSEMDKNQPRQWHWKHNVDAMIDQMPNIVDFPVPHDAQYYGPSYLFRGQHSKWADEKMETEIYRRFPNMKISTIADSGHNVHTDQPEATLQHVYRALNEIDIDFEEARGCPIVFYPFPIIILAVWLLSICGVVIVVIYRPIWDEILRKRKRSAAAMDEQVC